MIVPSRIFSIIYYIDKKNKEDFLWKLFDKTNSASKNKITDVFIALF